MYKCSRRSSLTAGSSYTYISWRMDPACKLWPIAIGAVAAPAIALKALCLDHPLAKLIHPPARLSSHTRAKL